MDDSVSGYDIVTLVVAIVGLGLALLALGWQAATFALSGSRVRVSIKRGYIGGGNLLTTPPQAWNSNLQAQLASQGLATVEILAVEVRNVGRMPVDVEKVDLKFDHGVSFMPPHGIPGSPALPHRLEHGSSTTWCAEASIVRAALAASHGAGIITAPADGLRFIVSLGNGKQVDTKKIPFS